MKQTITIRYPDKRRVKLKLPRVSRSIEETRKNYGYGLNMRQEPFLTQGAFPCLVCQGDGWIYDPNDGGPCSVEGNKMRDKLRCPKCLGKKTSTKAEFKEYHLAQQEKMRGEYEKALAQAQLLQQALDKLTAEEYQAIRRDPR
jgi:hypothetical protein